MAGEELEARMLAVGTAGVDLEDQSDGREPVGRTGALEHSHLQEKLKA